MAAASRVRLLMLSDNSAFSRELADHLRRPRLRYRLREAGSREGFFTGLENPSPDLILTGEGGVSGLGLNEVLATAQKVDRGVPVVVLGKSGPGSSAIRILRKGASDYLCMEEMERLPYVIERSLREHHIQVKHLHLQNKVQRAAGLMRESQRLATIGRLTGSIAHEINNPLESISNLLFLIEHEPNVPPAARNYLALAQGELERVVQISKQTLNFYRESSSLLPVQLSTLLSEVLVLYSRRIAEKRLEVVREFDSDEALEIFPGEIRQVFSNLITNAIEASLDQGILHLRIRKSRLWGDEKVVGLRVTIADNGAGMTPEVRHRVGESFFTTKGQGGTGLGLWVTQSIIRRYGGSLLLHSSTGEHHGTVFSVFIPTNLRPQAVAARSGAVLKPAEEQSFGGHREGWSARGA